MTPKQAAAWLGGGTLLAAWLAAAAAPSLAPESAAASAQSHVAEPDRTVLELAAEAERLRDRLSVISMPRPVTRNPFLFATRAPKTTHAASAPETFPSPVVAPVTLTLLGVGEDAAGTSPVRTAILSLAGELFLVKEGDTIGSGRYRLVRISADAAELEDTAESLTLRIALP